MGQISPNYPNLTHYPLFQESMTRAAHYLIPTQTRLKIVLGRTVQNHTMLNVSNPHSCLFPVSIFDRTSLYWQIGHGQIKFGVLFFEFGVFIFSLHSSETLPSSPPVSLSTPCTLVSRSCSPCLQSQMTRPYLLVYSLPWLLTTSPLSVNRSLQQSSSPASTGNHPSSTTAKCRCCSGPTSA